MLRSVMILWWAGLMTSMAAADALVDEIEAAVIADYSAVELAEPGNDLVARGLAEFLAEDPELPPGSLAELRLRTAEAWLAAGQPEPAQVLLDAVLNGDALAPELRRRAGLALIASWELQLRSAPEPAELPAPIEALAEHGAFSAVVQARAWSVEGQRQHALGDFEQALAAYDQALELLAEAEARARAPVYSLRVLSMEAAGAKSPAVHAWLQERQDDPAVQQILAAVLTAGDKMIGQPAPALAAPRVDQEGDWNLAEQEGQPVLVYFFATWVEQCQAVSPAVAAFAKQHPELQVVGVSMDTAETIKNLPAYQAATGTSYPLVGERLGWDSELDDSWHVQTIPAAYLVDGEGIVVAKDLIGPTAAETTGRLQQAMAALAGDAPAPADAPAPDPVAPAEPADEAIP